MQERKILMMNIGPKATEAVRHHLIENLELQPIKDEEIIKRPNLLFQPTWLEKGRAKMAVHKFTLRDLNNTRILQFKELQKMRTQEKFEETLAKKLQGIAGDKKLQVVYNGIGKNGAEYEVIHAAPDPFESRISIRTEFKPMSLEQSTAGYEPAQSTSLQHSETEKKIRKYLIENLGLAPLTAKQSQNVIFDPQLFKARGESTVTHEVIVNDTGKTLYAESPEFDSDISPKEIKEILQEELNKVAKGADVNVQLKHQGTKNAEYNVRHTEPAENARKKH